jgi:hypothetical protein
MLYGGVKAKTVIQAGAAVVRTDYDHFLRGREGFGVVRFCVDISLYGFLCDAM